MTGYSPYVNGGYNMGTPLDAFDFAQAVAPGNSESTYVAQLNKAIVYWQLQTTSPRPDVAARATLAVGWLQTELGLVSNPPANSLHIVYPV